MTYIQKIKQAKKLIKQYIEKYPKCAIACSFGKDSMVLYHLARSIKKDIPVFSVMTPFKPKTTLKYKARMEKKYKMNIKTHMAIWKNDIDKWWDTDPNACCDYYKVEPTREALKDYDCWFAGLRRDEGATRATMEFVVDPDRFGKIKVNPILWFTEKDVWRYLALNRIPVNPLYKKGYRSLGCEPCTHKEKDESEGERDGRWTGTCKKGGECGIHQSSH